MANHALITGSAVRVGRALALHLARQEWDITIHYHRSQEEAATLAQEIGNLGTRAGIINADLSKEEGANTVFQNISQVTLLVHNASIFQRDTLESLSAASFEAHMRINLLAPLILTQAFVKQLPSEATGQVVCLLDGMQGWSLSAHFLSYALSKAGLQQAVALLAPELAPRVRINGIALGATLPARHEDTATFEKLRRVIPLQKTSSPEAVCQALDFLLHAKDMTGQILDLSGGMGVRKTIPEA